MEYFIIFTATTGLYEQSKLLSFFLSCYHIDVPAEDYMNYYS